MIKIFTVAFFLVNSLFSQNSVVQQFSDSFADVAEAAKPAVVTIITDKIMKVPNNDLYFFFNPYMDPNGEREYKTNALGSGVIGDAKKGYIITNNHVVEDMDNIKVKLFDCFKVFIVSIEANAVIINKKNGKDSIEFRFWSK